MLLIGFCKRSTNCVCNEDTASLLSPPVPTPLWGGWVFPAAIATVSTVSCLDSGCVTANSAEGSIMPPQSISCTLSSQVNRLRFSISTCNFCVAASHLLHSLPPLSPWSTAYWSGGFNKKANVGSSAVSVPAFKRKTQREHDQGRNNKGHCGVLMKQLFFLLQHVGLCYRDLVRLQGSMFFHQLLQERLGCN